MMPSQVPTTHSQVRSGLKSGGEPVYIMPNYNMIYIYNIIMMQHNAKLKIYSQLGRILTVGAIALTLLYFASRSLNLFVEILTHFQS